MLLVFIIIIIIIIIMFLSNISYSNSADIELLISELLLLLFHNKYINFWILILHNNNKYTFHFLWMYCYS